MSIISNNYTCTCSITHLVALHMYYTHSNTDQHQLHVINFRTIAEGILYCSISLNSYNLLESFNLLVVIQFVIRIIALVVFMNREHCLIAAQKKKCVAMW